MTTTTHRKASGRHLAERPVSTLVTWFEVEVQIGFRV